MDARLEELSDQDFGHDYWRSAQVVPGPLADLSADSIDEGQFRLLADNIPTLCWIGNSDGYIVWYNRRWHEYCGTTPAEMEGWGWQSVHDPDVLPEVMERWTASVATGDPFEMTFPLRGADGVFRPFLTRVQPVRDSSGAIRRWFGVNTEISAQVAAQEALRESEERLRLVQAAGGIGSFDYDLQKDEAFCSPEYYELFGLPQGSKIDRETWDRALHPGDRQQALEALERGIADRKPFDYEYRIIRADNGEVRWLAGRASILFDSQDRPWRYVGGNIDITRRKKAEEHQRLLINELNHRVKNTLAVIQGIAFQTFKNKGVSADVQHAFDGRIAALAKAHDRLTELKWESAPLHQLVSDAVAPMGDGRMQVEGPELTLPPETAVAFAMALHELATNAAKYGSLSVPEGQVQVAWKCESDELRLEWRETGGPPVDAPAARGFGTRMIEQGLARELHGEVRIEFEPKGLVCTVRAPIPCGE